MARIFVLIKWHCLNWPTTGFISNKRLTNPALRRTPRTAEIPQHFQSQSLILATSNFRSEDHGTDLAAWVAPVTRTQGPSLRSTPHSNSLVWHCGNSSALTMELSQSYVKPSICALACFVVVNTNQFYPYPSGLLHWHWGNHTISPVLVMQPWRICVTWSHETIKIW